MLIECANLTKKYRKNKKEKGVKGTIKNLFKSEYQEILAVNNISFEMDYGESLACIGENGAGKSTLIKMLVGILTPTSGSVVVDGFGPNKDKKEYLRKIGVIFGQKTNLWWDIPVIESYEAVKVLYKLHPQEYKKNLDMVTELLDLDEIIHSPARQLSLGQRMKADIGMVFLHSPEILFLDEPTIGLDINVKFAVRKFIRQMNREKKVSVLLTSHDLSDIEEISDRAIVLSNGEIFYHGELEELNRRYATQRTIELTGSKKDDITKYASKVSIETKGLQTIIAFDVQDYSSDQILEYLSKCYSISDIKIKDSGIDQVVSQIFTEGAKVHGGI